MDIPDAYLNADMDKMVHIRLDGHMSELLVRVKPELYSIHLELNNDKKVLYVILPKEMYNCLKRGLLFWRHLSSAR